MNGIDKWVAQGNLFADNLNERLKTIETYEEFQEIEQELEACEWDLKFTSKRTGWWIFSIKHVYEYGSWKRYTPINLESNRNRISYLMSDTVSVGECHVGNFYRYFEVSNKYR